MGDIGLGHKILFFLREADNLVEKKFQMPVSFEIDASNYCQCDCEFCMFAEHIKTNRIHLTPELYYKAIWDMKRHGIKSITFTGGGEPLMNPAIREMIISTHRLGFKIGLVTNGVSLHIIHDLTDMLEYIRVSLDSATPETYIKVKRRDFFHKVCDNIREITSIDSADVGISFVINDTNRHEIDAFHDLAKELNVKYAQVKPELTLCELESQTSGIDRNKFFVTERYNIDSASMVACDLAGLVGILGATGKVYYCCIHRGKAEFEIGDLKDESLLGIFTRKRPFIKPDFSKCAGSCRYMNYAKIYEQVRGSQYIPLRHRRFI